MTAPRKESLWSWKGATEKEEFVASNLRVDDCDSK